MNAPVSAPARVSAQILNYRTPELVLDCLDSLVPQVDPRRDAVVVVDNASGDGSVEAIRRGLAERGWSERVRLIESPVNGGFAAGNNLALRAVDARAYLLLNSDTRVGEGAVERLWRALEAAPRAGLIGPRLEGEDGEVQSSCFRAPSPVSELIDASRTGPLARLLRRWQVAPPPGASPDRSVAGPEWTSFAAVMIRRDVLDQVGLLDEGYFMYYEDVDFCLRARAAGWQIRHEPRARVVHLHSRSSNLGALQRARRRKPPYVYASRARYYRKAYGTGGLLAANVLWTVGRGVAWLREVAGNKPPHTAERQLLDTWSAL